MLRWPVLHAVRTADRKRTSDRSPRFDKLSSEQTESPADALPVRFATDVAAAAGSAGGEIDIPLRGFSGRTVFDACGRVLRPNDP